MKQGFPGSKVRYSCNDATFLVISRGLLKEIPILPLRQVSGSTALLGTSAVHPKALLSPTAGNEQRLW